MHDDHEHYFIVAIASDGIIVDLNEVCEDDLDMVTVGAMPKGSYITCLAIPTQFH